MMAWVEREPFLKALSQKHGFEVLVLFHWCYEGGGGSCISSLRIQFCLVQMCCVSPHHGFCWFVCFLFGCCCFFSNFNSYVWFKTAIK